MNLILEKDGILAYIGTRSEFGEFKAKLERRTGEASIRCWISLPAYTIQSMLGLCPHTTEAGRSEVIFYGSPLTLMLAAMFKAEHCDIGDFWHAQYKAGLPVHVKQVWVDVRLSDPLWIFPIEYQRAISYYEEYNTPFGPTANGHEYIGLSTLRIG